MTGALFEQSRERRFDSVQILEPRIYIDQMSGRELCGCAALHPAVEAQQLPDFFQAKPQPLC